MAKAEGSHEMLNRVMTKDNIALAALLETKKDLWVNGKFRLAVFKPPLKHSSVW